MLLAWTVASLAAAAVACVCVLVVVRNALVAVCDRLGATQRAALANEQEPILSPRDTIAQKYRQLPYASPVVWRQLSHDKKHDSVRSGCAVS